MRSVRDLPPWLGRWEEEKQYQRAFEQLVEALKREDS